MFYQIKKKIIMNNFAKKKKNNPFKLEESELYQLPADASTSINNSYFFTAHSTNGDTLVIRLGLRNNMPSELFFYYKHEGLFLVHEKAYYDAKTCPFKVSCITPGEKWKCTFNGKLKEYNGDKLYDCKLDAIFTATLPIFDFFYDSNSKGMAISIAKQKWNKKFFAEVKENDQRHYEQTGIIEGTFTVNNEDNIFKLNCVRDHSFGTRNWDYMDDHIWVCGITDDGEVVNFSFVNYPSMKGVYLGYSNMFTGKNEAISSYELISYDINGGIGPDNAEIKLVFDKNKQITIKMKRDANLPIYFGDNKYVFQEGIGEFEINGKKGRGTIEYGFNTNPKRWNY